ncbi:MAG: hypothetical protein EA397_14160 [Deltaproteobacteria bacterium]|nr:MAG: hypothetical protein EA397_14160 [Deltaproteobacteria bacterium]
MPPRPGSRLDLYLVPTQGRTLPSQEVLKSALSEQGIDLEGDASGRLVDGGFASIRLDRPPRLTLYANRQGGFRVRCPAGGQNIVPSFNAALSSWRAGGQATIAECGACGGEHALSELDFAPPAALGRGAIVLVDVGSMRLTAEGGARFEAILGPFVIVGSRR